MSTTASAPSLAARLSAAAFTLLIAAPAAAQVACGDTVTTSVTLTADLTCGGAQGRIGGMCQTRQPLNGSRRSHRLALFALQQRAQEPMWLHAPCKAVARTVRQLFEQ